jgi:hypothetical protein
MLLINFGAKVRLRSLQCFSVSLKKAAEDIGDYYSLDIKRVTDLEAM